MDFLYSAVYSFGNHVLVEWLCKQDEPDVLGHVAVVFPDGSRRRNSMSHKLDGLYEENRDGTQGFKKTAGIPGTAQKSH